MSNMESPVAEKMNIAATSEWPFWRRRVIAGTALFAALVIIHFLAYPWPLKFWLETALATALQCYVGWPFYLGALRRASPSPNIDTLIALVTTAGYMIGMVEVFRPVWSIDPGWPFVVTGLILELATLRRFLAIRNTAGAGKATPQNR
jgi:cation transport ATPase